MNPKLVLAISNLSRSYGEMIGTLEGIAAASDKDTRDNINSLLCDIAGCEPLLELVELLATPNAVSESDDAK